MLRGVPGRLRRNSARLLLLFALTWLGRAQAAAQDIRIEVLDGRNGRPVTNQCLNVWVPGERGFDAVIPTDSSGIAVFRLAGDPNNWIKKGRCKGAVAPYPPVTHAQAIQPFPAWPVDCRVHKIGPHQYSPLPTYSVREILDTGVVAEDFCGKVKVSATAGELIIFTRPLRPWEWIEYGWDL